MSINLFCETKHNEFIELDSDDEQSMSDSEPTIPSFNFYKLIETTKNYEFADPGSRDNIENPVTNQNLAIPAFNFYKPIEKKNEQLTCTDKYSNVRALIHSEKFLNYTSQYPDDTFVRCNPTFINTFMERCFREGEILLMNENSDPPYNMVAAEIIKNSALTYLKETVRHESTPKDLIIKIRKYDQHTIFYAFLNLLVHPQFHKQETTALIREYYKIAVVLVGVENDEVVLDRFAACVRRRIISNVLTSLKNIELLTFFYTMVYKMKNQWALVFDFLYESLYVFKYKAPTIMVKILQVWPEIFQQYDKKNSLLIRTMSYIMLNFHMKTGIQLYKLDLLQETLQYNYGYKRTQLTVEQYAAYMMNNFEDRTFSKSIVLFCKRQNHTWVYTVMLKQYLLPIIELWLSKEQVPEWLLIKTITAFIEIIRAIPKVSKHFGGNKAIIDILMTILNTADPNAWRLQEAVICQLWNMSVLTANVVYKIKQWKPPNNTVSNAMLKNIRYYLFLSRNMTVNQNWAVDVKYKLKQSENKIRDNSDTVRKPSST